MMFDITRHEKDRYLLMTTFLKHTLSALGGGGEIKNDHMDPQIAIRKRSIFVL